jgi:hypothetical protein
MQLLHEPVPRSIGTFKVAYASNWHRNHVRRALKLYTRTMPESDLEDAESERQSSHDKSRGQIGIIRWRERERDEGTCATTTLAYP